MADPGGATSAFHMSNRCADTGESAVNVFRDVRGAFDEAARAAGGVVERTFAIGGHPVVLRFAGPALVSRLSAALAHLAAPEGAAPALTIRIWDGESTGATAPALPAWWWRESTFRGPVQAYHGDRIHTAVHAATLSLFDAATDEGLYWVGDPGQLTCSETGSPVLRLLHWWMRTRRLQLVHGGAVGTSDGGVILAGRGGSGKSTICLQSLASDLQYAADDYCLVATDPAPYVHSLYCSGKVDAGDITRFPFLEPALSNRDRLDVEKAMYLLHDHFASHLSAGFPVRAVLVPRITGRPDTKVERVPGAAGLLALAPSTIFQLPGAGAPALHSLGRLTSQVPCYRLDVGTDVARIPGVILDLLSRP